MTTIYVELLNEGTSVWRPVNAVPLGNDLYRIDPSAIPGFHQWAFQPGEVVRCRLRQFQNGSGLEAVQAIPGVDHE